jgi:hypothetical protein
VFANGGQGKIYFCGRVCASGLSQASQHTLKSEDPQFLSLISLCPSPWWTVWVHNFHHWLKLRFRGGHRGKEDMFGKHGQKLNLVGILKDKGWNSRILGKLRPEMTI